LTRIRDGKEWRTGGETMNFGIVSDSSCDLPESYVQTEQVEIVSFYLSFDGEEYYREGKEISIPEFYQRMAENPDCFPKTSMPSIQDYVDAFLSFVKKGLPVLCICLSRKLSGSLQAAVNAKQVVEEQFQGARIEVVDSCLATALQGMLVKNAVEMRNAGKTLDEAAEALRSLRQSGHIFFTTDDLKYLEHGGRIGKVASVAGSVLKIKPLIQFYDGELGSAELCRGRKKSLQKIIDKMESYIQDLKIEPEDYFLVTGVGLWVPEYDEFKMRLRERLGTSGFRVREWEDIQIGATIGVHTGPYPLGAGLLRQWKKEM
jgi:DegV family protein with EDD domain